MSIKIYSKPNCPNCDLTKRDMDILGIEYTTIDLTKDTSALQRLVSQGHRSAPVVEAYGDTWSGYNQEKIKGLLCHV